MTAGVKVERTAEWKVVSMDVLKVGSTVEVMAAQSVGVLEICWADNWVALSALLWAVERVGLRVGVRVGLRAG